MYHLVVVDHSLADDIYWRRWQILAEKYDIRVSVLVPEEWESNWFDSETRYNPENIDEGLFQVHPLPTTSQSNWNRYLFRSLDAKIRELDPEHIHIQHHEMTWIHQQLILYAKLWSEKVRLTFFTMNALGVRQEKWHQRLRWASLRQNMDAAFCHYDGCRESLRDAGYQKPIYVQTSYGVNDYEFYPDAAKRCETRERLDLQDRFIVGYAGRLTEKKGVDTLFDALPIEDVNWGLLLVGDGPMRDEIEYRISENGWENQVRLMGQLSHEDVPEMLRAMDAFVLGSRTTSDWIDTFPRSIVEAMACEVPVVGSKSGAIPYQVGDAGLLFPEGDVDSLRSNLRTLATEPARRKELAKRGRKQALSRFSQESLADAFYEAIQDLETDCTGIKDI